MRVAVPRVITNAISRRLFPRRWVELEKRVHVTGVARETQEFRFWQWQLIIERELRVKR